MTLREEMVLRLGDRGLSQAEAEECMHHVMQVAKAQDYFQEDLYGDENCWEWDISRFKPDYRLFHIFDGFVLHEAFKWNVTRLRALEATLQEIHRLSSSSLQEQERDAAL